MTTFSTNELQKAAAYLPFLVYDYKKQEKGCSKMGAVLRSWNVNWNERFRKTPMVVIISVMMAHRFLTTTTLNVGLDDILEEMRNHEIEIEPAGSD